MLHIKYRGYRSPVLFASSTLLKSKGEINMNKNKERIKEIAEKAIVIGLSMNVAYLLFAVLFKAATEILCSLINPYSICCILALILVFQSYTVAKQGVPGGEDRAKADTLKAADAHRIKNQFRE